MLASCQDDLCKNSVPSKTEFFSVSLSYKVKSWDCYHRYYSRFWTFFVAETFFSRVLFFGKKWYKIGIFHVFRSQIFPWRQNENSTSISVSECSNCLLSNRESLRSVAFSGTARQSQHWEHFLIFTNFEPKPETTTRFPNDALQWNSF